MLEMEGENEEVKPRLAVDAGENNLGSGAAHGDGGEERDGVQIGRNGAVLGGGLGSVVAGAGFSVQNPIREARSPEVLSSGPYATTVLPTQLTIFYGGSVSVFDGIPADKVHEILHIAATAAKATETKNSISINPAPSPTLRRAPSFSSTSTVASPGAQSYPIQPNSFCRLAADLPIARRHSLQRFLEKRRDRLVNKNPYSAPTNKKVEDAAANPVIGSPSAAYCLEKNQGRFEENQPKAVS